jgi:DNA-directed RNA polymerase specialized sigma subunit
MKQNEHKKLWEKLKRYGRRFGLNQEAEDFASWATIKYIEGRKATNYQLYVDYRREHHGDDRSNSGDARKNERYFYEPIDKINDATLHSDASRQLEIYRKDSLMEVLIASLSTFEQTIIDMYLDNITMTNIALIMDLTEGRISQLIKSITRKLKNEIQQIRQN